MPEEDAEGTAHSRAEQETVPPTIAAPEMGGTKAMPERFGRYRIVRELGQVAMGSVYLAEDTELHRQVALKIPKFAQQEQSELLERFYREARSAATLNHPNICQVHDIGEHEGTRYITMAYVSGPPLSKLVGTPKVRSERIIAKLVRKIAVGLVAAHNKGILHRDLKPGNILLDERNEPVITDFGLARQVEQDADSRLTQDGTLLGTPAYMSPEQVSGDPERMSPASDVYSLGVILYELLTGKLPYKGPIMAVIGQIIEGKPKPPSELRSDLDKRLEAICLKMMAHSVQSRYSSANEAATALSHYLEQTSTQSQTIPPQAGGAQAKLEEHKQHTIELLKQGKFNEAAGRLQKLAGVGGAGAEPYAQWATAELVRLKAMPKDAFEKGTGLVAETIRLLAQQDYARVIELLEGVPHEYRSAEAAQLLKQAQELKAEADQLNARMKEAVRDREYDGIRENVLERLLELEPGNLMARDIYEHLGTYGPDEKLFFDKTGMLLPARGKYWWLDHLARLISQRMTRRTVQRTKAGARRKGEPAPADEARSAVPVVPIAIGLGVVGLLLLGVVLILRTPKGTIVVEIDEPNAVVSVDDGKLQFTTTEDDQSIEIQLKKGEHTVTVTKDGYEPFTRQLLVRKGQTETIQIDLASASIQETGAVASGGTVAGSGTEPLSTGLPDTAKIASAKTPERITEASALESGFVSLFDGRTLGGWQGATQGYRVEGGALVCTGDSGGTLFTTKQYGNFILQFDFQLESGGNNGVAIRAPLEGKVSRDGMEIQILDDSASKYANLKPHQYHGSIFGVAPARRGHLKSVGQWNSQEIVCSGRNVRVTLNGTNILDVNLDELGPDARKQCPGIERDTGYVGFFGHGSRVEFRNIRIKELSDVSSPAVSKTATSVNDDVPLFNGRDLTGWTPMSSFVHVSLGEQHQPSQGGWTVEDGTLVCSTQEPGWLKTNQQFSDFVLRLEFKLPANGNSDVYIRCPGTGRLSKTGMAIQIIDDDSSEYSHRPVNRTGAIYGVVGPSQNVVCPANQWNSMEIRCLRDDVHVVLNGTSIVDADMYEYDALRNLPRSGFIGLANWRGLAKGTAFRNIRIKELTKSQIKVGIIGLDGHAVAFAKILNDVNATGDVAGCSVIAAYPTEGSADIELSYKSLPKYTAEIRSLGVEIVDSIDELLKRVDAVLLLSIDGRSHLDQVRPVLKAGKPVFVDKPIAGSLRDAATIVAEAKAAGVPMFSSSALRFGQNTQAARNLSLGRIRHCETHCPTPLEPTHPDLFWYGIHGVESLFTVMGPGCLSVTRTTEDGKIKVVGNWQGGRTGVYREGKGYGGRAVGDKGEGPVGSFGGYEPLMIEVAKFLRSGRPPVSAEETIELFAFMEAADESKRRGGAEISLDGVLKAADADSR